MSTKTCSKCRVVKDSTEFGASKQSKDGLLCQCRVCVREYHKRYCREHRKEIAEWSKKYREANPELWAKAKKKYRAKYPERRAAHSSNSNRKRDSKGKQRPTCEHCGAPGKHWHHEDYSKPDDVISLCVDCHLKAHGRSAVFILDAGELNEAFGGEE